jgi:hypothetical protein
MTDVAVTEALGESLSPSQVNTYMTFPPKCIARLYKHCRFPAPISIYFMTIDPC